MLTNTNTTSNPAFHLWCNPNLHVFLRENINTCLLIHTYPGSAMATHFPMPTCKALAPKARQDWHLSGSTFTEEFWATRPHFSISRRKGYTHLRRDISIFGKTPGLPFWKGSSQRDIPIWNRQDRAQILPRCAGTFGGWGGLLYTQYALVETPQRSVSLRWKTGGEFRPRCSGTFQCTGRGLYLFAVSLG